MFLPHHVLSLIFLTSELYDLILFDFKHVLLFLEIIFRSLLFLCALSGAEGHMGAFCEYLGE